MMILDSLGSILVGLNFFSSLLKSPTVSQENALDPVFAEAGQIADISRIDAQAFPFSGLIESGGQENITSLAAFQSRINTRSSDFSRSSLNTSEFAPPSAASRVKISRHFEVENVKTQDASCSVEAYVSPIVTAQPFAPYNKVQADVYRYRQQQSVNLGSWFVHEKWMTPSLFKCASGKQLSEIDIASGYGSVAAARSILERHWDTFITADDFAYLASIGINTVRLPIGYWNLGPPYCQKTPFEPLADVYRTSWPHVVHAINMAAEVGMGVLVDLHGAVGSQNGHDHSGISDGQTNLFTNSANQDKTIAVLTFLTEQLSTVTNVVGIEILNEPQDVPQLTGFYTRALNTLRQLSPQAAVMPFYIHDGFDQQRFHDFISTRTDFVVQDHHSYFVFTDKDNSESVDDHTKAITGPIAESLSKDSHGQRDNFVVDEFSCALSAGSLAKVEDPESAQKRFCVGQVQVYQKSTAGWSFWSYTKEGCEGDGGWCFKYAVGKYLPATFFSYPRGSSDAKDSLNTVTSRLINMQRPSVPYILQLYRLHEQSKLLDAFTAHLGTLSDSVVTRSLRPFVRPERGHRFAAVHSRRQPAGQPVYFSPISLPPSEDAIVRGFGDGVSTAKTFAAFGLSKLGFVGQFIEDHLQTLGDSIGPGQKDSYREWFRKGLEHGEDLVSGIALAVK